MFPYRASASAMAIIRPRMCATWYVRAIRADAFVQMRGGTRLGARMYDIVLAHESLTEVGPSTRRVKMIGPSKCVT